MDSALYPSPHRPQQQQQQIHFGSGSSCERQRSSRGFVVALPSSTQSRQESILLHSCRLFCFFCGPDLLHRVRRRRRRRRRPQGHRLHFCYLFGSHLSTAGIDDSATAAAAAAGPLQQQQQQQSHCSTRYAIYDIIFIFLPPRASSSPSSSSSSSQLRSTSSSIADGSLLDPLCCRVFVRSSSILDCTTSTLRLRKRGGTLPRFSSPFFHRESCTCIVVVVVVDNLRLAQNNFSPCSRQHTSWSALPVTTSTPSLAPTAAAAAAAAAGTLQQQQQQQLRRPTARLHIFEKLLDQILGRERVSGRSRFHLRTFFGRPALAHFIKHRRWYPTQQQQPQQLQQDYSGSSSSDRTVQRDP